LKAVIYFVSNRAFHPPTNDDSPTARGLIANLHSKDRHAYNLSKKVQHVQLPSNSGFAHREMFKTNFIWAKVAIGA
jgi:hypothetical protein